MGLWLIRNFNLYYTSHILMRKDAHRAVIGLGQGLRELKDVAAWHRKAHAEAIQGPQRDD